MLILCPVPFIDLLPLEYPQESPRKRWSYKCSHEGQMHCTFAQLVAHVTPLQAMLLLILLGSLPVTTSGPSNMPPTSLTISSITDVPWLAASTSPLLSAAIHLPWAHSCTVTGRAFQAVPCFPLCLSPPRHQMKTLPLTESPGFILTCK